MSLVVAGERSGVGKTTVTLALLAALAQRQRVQAFKGGPDYIDPMFHRAITGRPSYNLDPVLTSEAYVRRSFAAHSRGADAVVVEGVMGLFDGASAVDDTASTAHIARLLRLPVLLVLDCSRLSRSVAAILHGYCSFDPRLQIAGVVLNRVGSDRHLELLRGAIGDRVPILGVLRREEGITIPDRHLGLVPAAEIPWLGELMDRLGELGRRCFDWPRLEPLLAPAAAGVEGGTEEVQGARVRVAIATDAAFSFYYPDSLDRLSRLGAELVPWSPMADSQLPEHCSGLYFGGGFPEMFAAQLAANQPMRQQVAAAIAIGMPTYAECGGLMYLCRQLVDLQGQEWPMAGVLPTDVRMEPRLTLGYRRAVPLATSSLLAARQPLWGHEFHRSQTTCPSPTPLYRLYRYGAEHPHADEGWRLPQLHASYVHLHWGEGEVTQKWLRACRWFGQRHQL